MRVLVDVVHPANVLFFLNPIRMMRERGDEVLILSRHKDIACRLLDEFGLPHTPISRAGRGVLGLARELPRRDLALLRKARRFRPDVMVGFGGVAISHVGAVLGVPSVSFYDTEVATLQNRITWPFIRHLYVPECFTGRVPASRTTRFRGIKELSFFHPDNFTPSRERAVAGGLDPDADNFFIRVVAWHANHDLGKSGWSDALLRAVVDLLSRRGRVHLSSERPLPPDLEPYLYSGPITEVHHLLAHCRLYIGESATMTAEAAVLGLPAVFLGDDFRGYLVELERENLAAQVRAASVPAVTEALEGLLAVPAEEWRARRDAYVAARPNLARYIVEALDRHAAC